MNLNQTPSVCLLSEVPEGLLESLKGFLDDHQDWDQNRVMASALSLFLLQNGQKDRTTSEIYLSTILS